MDSTNAINKTISRYRIERVLGSGAMGVVYLAFDQQIQREVALKVLHPHLRIGAAGEELEQRFLQEARAAARCTHGNIVTIYDFGIHNDESFIVMEYVKGTELKAYLNRGTPIPLLSACDICVQVLEALAHAHDKGVIHRDIKPANIMVLDNALIKVSDFGVARLDNSDLTGTGMMIGTPNYMSPEARIGEDVDHRSDLYSVGVLLYELMCSEKPDISAPVEQVLAQFEAKGVLGGEKLASIKRILSFALQPQSAQRFQHARAFIAALKGVTNPNATKPGVTNPRLTNSSKALNEATRLAMPRPSVQVEQVNGSVAGSQSQWHPEMLSSIEYSLAEFVGPMAKLLVRKQSKTTHHFDTLISCLAQHIPNQAERTQFMKKAEQSSAGIQKVARDPLDETIPTSIQVGTKFDASGQSPVGQLILSQATFKQLTSFLAYYVGPLASRMVKSTMRSTSEPNALLCQLASQIPHEEERQKFMDEARRLF